MKSTNYRHTVVPQGAQPFGCFQTRANVLTREIAKMTRSLLVPSVFVAVALASAALAAEPAADPVRDAIAAGDAAIAAADLDTALQRYEEATKADAENPWGHYRVGEVRRAKGQLSEARASFEAALRLAGKDANVKAKALFVLADLAERESKLADAQATWQKYGAHAQRHSDIKAFAATADERQKRIATWEQMNRDYASVRERIKKRESELTSKAMTPAQ